MRVALAAAMAFGLSAWTIPSVAASAAGNGPALTSLKIATVPTLDAEPVLYAQSRGYYKDAGLDVHISTNDAGPAVVTGVINGTYDAAAAAWFPVAIAISKGAKLKYVTPITFIDHEGHHGVSGIVIKPDSSIKNYKDLAGKTVAVNALTSTLTLDVKTVVRRAGADPDTIKFVALPFKTGVQAVAQGQVDAAMVVSPFQTEGVIHGLKVLGDPTYDVNPQGTPSVMLFTSAASWSKHAKALKAFEEATFKAARELNADEALGRKLAGQLFGLPVAVSQRVPLPGFATGPMDPHIMQETLDHAHKYGYLARALRARDVLAQ